MNLSLIKMKHIGLFFGSFNPIHVGHLIIANHIAEYSEVDEVWMVVTPHNPHKKKETLLADHHRYAMVEIATRDFPKLRPCDIEFKLPQPNYTVNTLAYLTEKYPEYRFSLIMGTDNLNTFHKWKNYEVILQNHHIIVYPRTAESTMDNDFTNHPKVTFIDAPLMEISSTFIRKAIADKKNVRAYFPETVWNYIDEMNFYKK
ncbi:MAG TPA: nicotinate (nicotinamide) nucleotide adenylyltransferase [Flavobacteriaceae bacterium]|nr:nicotinate (nicotinamide) nucleotide adenylyltransferase [Flavobacteriaceae bacterium]